MRALLSIRSVNPEGRLQIGEIKQTSSAHPAADRQTGIRANDPANSRYPQLDLIRGVAACAVAGGHLRNLFFQDYEKLQSPSAFCKVLYFLTGLGHEAVVVFFVLSGFVIANSIVASIGKGTWSWRGYLISRLTRLWVVLIPAILLGVFLDKAGISSLVGGGIYRCVGFGHVLRGTEPEQLSPTVVAGNLLFLQTILVPTVGSNSPLWSLANEFWYYIAFPLLLLACQRGKSTLLRILLALGALSVLALVGSGISTYFSIWLMGCAAFYGASSLPIHSKTRAQGIYWLGGLLTLTLLIAIRGRALGGLGAFAQDFVLGLGVACMLLGAANLRPSGKLSVWSKTSLALARPSYSLYVLHLPLLVCLASRLFKSEDERWVPDLKHLACGLGVAAVCALYVWAVYCVTEAKTSQVRGWVLRRLPSTWPKDIEKVQAVLAKPRSLT